MLLKSKPTTNLITVNIKKLLKFDKCQLIMDEASSLRIFGKVLSEKLGTLNMYSLHTAPGFQMVEINTCQHCTLQVNTIHSICT